MNNYKELSDRLLLVAEANDTILFDLIIDMIKDIYDEMKDLDSKISDPTISATIEICAGKVGRRITYLEELKKIIYT